MIKRRHFLQFSAATLASLGLSPFHIQNQSLRYGKALAQSTQRKRALLVGIQDYGSNFLGITRLKGCETDLEMQKYLLIHRFGFLEEDIQVLLNEEATRENVLAAFESHLIAACAEGDVAVFHFSGHGRRVNDPNPVQVYSGDSENDEVERDLCNSSLVAYPGSDKSPDIMGRTLFLLTSQMKTDNVTLVLDSCYAEGGIRGNARIRSVGSGCLEVSQAELEYQDRLQARLGITPEELQRQRDISVSKGLALSAARRDQEAVEYTFDTQSGGTLDAGVYTYFLTQHLWQEIEPANQVIFNVSHRLEAEAFGQDPSVCISGNECNPDNPGRTAFSTYFVDSNETDRVPPAEGVLKIMDSSMNRVNNGLQAVAWLGGSDEYSLATYGSGATFTAIAPDGTPAQDGIVVRSRKGLWAEVVLPTELPDGTLIQESSRVIPEDYKLRVGLDSSVMSEMEAIQSTFGRIRRLELVPFQSVEDPYPVDIQYVLSRVTTDHVRLLQTQRNSTNISEQALPEQGSLAIFSQGLNEVIPESWGESGESIAAASDRLSTRLNALVAARLMKLLINAKSSQLAIQAEMQVVDGESKQAQSFTVRRSRGSNVSIPESGNFLQIPIGKLLQLKVVHQEPALLYLIVLLADRTGKILPIFPRYFSSITPDDTMILPNEPKLIPEQTDSWKLQALQTGYVEALVIASRTPMLQAIQALRHERTATTSVIEALRNDLSGKNGLRGRENRDFRIPVSSIAVMSIPFQIVEGD